MLFGDGGSGFDRDRFGLARYLGQAEVENLGVPALGDENVGGLDVAMNDALGVSGVERVGHLDADAQQDAIQFHGAIRRSMLQGQRRPETPWR